MTTAERLRPIFERVLKGPIADFGPNTSPADIKRWDSVTHVNLIMEIEETFDVEFRMEDLGRLQSVGVICEALDELCSDRAVNDGG